MTVNFNRLVDQVKFRGNHLFVVFRGFRFLRHHRDDRRMNAGPHHPNVKVGHATVAMLFDALANCLSDTARSSEVQKNRTGVGEQSQGPTCDQALTTNPKTATASTWLKAI